MTDAERQEVRAVARQAVVEFLAEILVGAVKLNGAPGAAPTVEVHEAPTEAFDRFLGRIADAKTAEELTSFELIEREGPNRPEVFAAIGERMKALADAAG